MPISPSIGEVVAANGQVFAEVDGDTRTLANGDPIYENDVLVTSKGANLEVKFLDGTVMSQGASSRLTVDTYVFDPDHPQDSNFLLDMAKGSFRMATGQIADENPDGVHMKSPLATIGIRGTTTVHEVYPIGEKHGAEQVTGGRSVLLTDQFGNTQVLTTGKLIADLKPGQPMGGLRPMTPQEQNAFQTLTPLTSHGEPPAPPQGDDGTAEGPEDDGEQAGAEGEGAEGGGGEGGDGEDAGAEGEDGEAAGSEEDGEVGGAEPGNGEAAEPGGENDATGGEGDHGGEQGQQEVLGNSGADFDFGSGLDGRTDAQRDADAGRQNLEREFQEVGGGREPQDEDEDRQPQRDSGNGQQNSGNDDKQQIADDDDDDDYYAYDDEDNDDDSSGSGDHFPSQGGVIEGTSSAELLSGSEADDTIYAYCGDDTITASEGDDEIWGGNHAKLGDFVDYSATTAALTVEFASDGVATVSDGTDTDDLHEVELVVGGSGDDSFIIEEGATGALGHVGIAGGGGDDTIESMAPDSGNDAVASYMDKDHGFEVNLTQGYATDGSETDTLINLGGALGGEGDDTLIGRWGEHDFFMGNGGDDTIMSADFLHQTGDDGTFDGVSYAMATNGIYAVLDMGVEHLSDGDGGDSTVVGGMVNGGASDGVDALYNIGEITGSDYDDVLIGGIDTTSGTVVSTQRTDYYFGGSLGDDTIVGGNEGGIQDWVDYEDLGRQTGQGIYVDLDTDTLSGVDMNFSDSALGSAGNVIVYSGTTIGMASLVGGGMEDTLSSIEAVEGTDYDDTIIGNASSNTFEGGLGSNYMKGGDAGSFDVVSYRDFDEGIDLSFSDVGTSTMAHHVDDVDTLVDISGIVGSEYDDRIIYTESSATEDTQLIGRGGDDTLVGGDGAGGDTLLGDYDGDHDPLLHGNDSIVGGFGDDNIVGGGGHDVIDGGDGNDQIMGGDNWTSGLSDYGDLDNDTIHGGAGNDAIDGGYGEDWLYGDADNDQISGGYDNDKLYGGAGDDCLSGDSCSDTLFGDDGEDTLSGGAHNDWLHGGLGHDTLMGGTGADVFHFAEGGSSDFDKVMDFSRVEGDSIHLEISEDLFGADMVVGGDDAVYTRGGQLSAGHNMGDGFMMSGVNATGIGSAIQAAGWGGITVANTKFVIFGYATGEQNLYAFGVHDTNGAAAGGLTVTNTVTLGHFSSISKFTTGNPATTTANAAHMMSAHDIILV